MTGERAPAIPTIWRWCRRGIRGVTLAYVRQGRRIRVRREALLRFFEDLARADEPLPEGGPWAREPRSRSALRRERALVSAERTLESE